MYFVADMWQREGTSINVQKDITEQLSERLRKNPHIKNVTSTIGSGNLRFMLTYSPPDSDNAFSELLVEVNPGGDPQELLRETQRIIDEEMPGVTGVCKLFSKGASMAPVIEARFYGDDPVVLGVWHKKPAKSWSKTRYITASGSTGMTELRCSAPRFARTECRVWD